MKQIIREMRKQADKILKLRKELEWRTIKPRSGRSNIEMIVKANKQEVVFIFRAFEDFWDKQPRKFEIRFTRRNEEVLWQQLSIFTAYYIFIRMRRDLDRFIEEKRGR